MVSKIVIIPVLGFPIFESEQHLWDSMKREFGKTSLYANDILVVAHTPFSRILGPVYKLEDITPSSNAIEIANKTKKDPRKVEVILQNSREIIKVGHQVIIAKNHADIICANAGVDESNAGQGCLIGIPKDPDLLAKKIRKFILDTFKIRVAVIISDTVGRVLRLGATNIAIGTSGIATTVSSIGKKDLFGYTLQVSITAIADEIAAAAELVQGQTDEGIPMVIVRGYKYEVNEVATAKELNRPDENRLFK